jgi:hypothetical protein
MELWKAVDAHIEGVEAKNGTTFLVESIAESVTLASRKILPALHMPPLLHIINVGSLGTVPTSLSNLLAKMAVSWI